MVALDSIRAFTLTLATRLMEPLCARNTIPTVTPIDKLAVSSVSEGVRSIRWHLVMLALCVLAPQILLGGYLAYRNADEIRTSIEGSTNELARRLSDTVDREIVGLIGVLQGLATSSSLQRKDFQAFYPEVAKAFIGTRATGVAVRNISGDLLVNTNSPLGASLPPSNPVLRQFDREVIESRRAVVSDIHMGAVSRRFLVLVGVPVGMPDGDSYSMATGVDPKDILAIVGGIGLPEGWLAVVLDRSRHVVARSREPDKYIGAPASPEFLASAVGDAGRVLSTTLEGEPVFTAYAVSKVSRWMVLVSAPRSLLDKPVRVLWWSLAGLVGMAALTSAIAAVYFSRLIGRGLQELAREAQAVGRGAAPGAPRSAVAEVLQVHEELAAAARKLAWREAHQIELMAELDHRVKNTLTVLQSLIERTMRTASSRDQGAKLLQGRVMALARSHEALSDARWERVRLSALVDSMASSDQLELHAAGPEVWLAPRAVVSIAQTLHELGALSRPPTSMATSGQVDLGWRLEADDLVMAWVVQGGLLSAPDRSSFGYEIIRLCVERQLGGRATWVQKSDGFEFQARIPLKSDVLGPNAFVEAAE